MLLDCMHCAGRGEVPDGYVVQNDPEDLHTCPVCGGTGLLPHCTPPRHAEPVDELWFYEHDEIGAEERELTPPIGAVLGDALWVLGPDRPAPLTIWDRPASPEPYWH